MTLTAAPIRVPGEEVAAEKLILLLGRYRRSQGGGQVVIAPPDATLGLGVMKVFDRDTNRHTGLAGAAGGAIGIVMTAPESGTGKTAVLFLGAGAIEFRDELPFPLPGKIGAWAFGGHDKEVG